MKRALTSTTRLGAIAAAVVAIAAGVVLSGCDTSPENADQVSEGMGIKLDDLLFNVQITRQLNPGDTEDKAYLVGQKPLGPNQYFLGVFMRVQNQGDTSAQVPTDMSVVDTVGDSFKPLPSDSLFALSWATPFTGATSCRKASQWPRTARSRDRWSSSGSRLRRFRTGRSPFTSRRRRARQAKSSLTSDAALRATLGPSIEE